MNSRNIFVRKLIYLGCIALLLVPLFWLSQPATSAMKGEKARPGGVLSQLRAKHHLSPAQLGEIDPTSVTVKLATLGLRGVAANILWEKANDYKMKKDWTNLGATLNQITKVQPNFINVWTNQAWNLSYNVSVEFDDYRERYRWVIKGFKFLAEGIKYNESQPRLPWEMGRMVSQKIGKADESKQFRRLFAADTDFFESLPADIRSAGPDKSCLDNRGRPDNWLVGKRWYEKAVEMVETTATGMMGQSPLIYRSSAPMCQMNYAEAVEKEGTFGEVAQKAWSDASADWTRYGGESIPTSYKQEDGDTPIMIRLNDMEREEADAKKALAQLEAIQPGLRDSMIAEKKAALTEAQRTALDTPVEKRTGKQHEDAAKAEEAIRVTHDEVARKIAGPRRDEAKKLAKEAAAHEQLALYIRRYRDIVNFPYWRLKAQVEQGQDLRDARKLIHEGDRAFAENLLIPARDAYRQGFQAWRKVLDTHKEYATDVTTGEDLMEMIGKYRKLLSAIDEPFPEPFILQDIIDAQQNQSGAPPPPPKDEKKPAEKKA